MLFVQLTVSSNLSSRLSSVISVAPYRMETTHNRCISRSYHQNQIII